MPSITGASASIGLLGLAPREIDRGGGDAEVREVAVVRADLGERRTRRGQLAHACLRLKYAGAAGQGKWMLAREQRLHPFRGAERGESLVESALRQAEETSCIVHDQLAARLTIRMERALRALGLDTLPPWQDALRAFVREDQERERG